MPRRGNSYGIPGSWVMVCKRTDDPKLAWIEEQLDVRGIPHKRGWPSFHADATLWVPKKGEGVVTEILLTPAPGRFRRWYKVIDDMPDDHRLFAPRIGGFFHA